MMKKTSTFISGVLAFGVYLGIVGLFIFYFNMRDNQKSVHYVKKNQERIQVSISKPKANVPKAKKKSKNQKSKKKKVKKKKVKKKKIQKKKAIPKKVVKKETVKKKKVVKKKVIKEKVVKKVKKSKEHNTTRPKKVNKPKDLFANVSSKKKKTKPKKLIRVTDKPIKVKSNNFIKVSDKPSASNLVASSLKVQKNSDRGIENAYFARIEEKLKGWPAQSDYAGEKAKVSIRVEPSGDFIFKLTTASGNAQFNEGLNAYLKQLQGIGFGPHKGNRAYDVDVEFVATE